MISKTGGLTGKTLAVWQRFLLICKTGKNTRHDLPTLHTSEPETSKPDPVSEFYAAKMRLDGQDCSSREHDVRMIIGALEKLAIAFVRAAERNALPTVHFELDSDPSAHVRRLATAALIPGTTDYRVRGSEQEQSEIVR